MPVLQALAVVALSALPAVATPASPLRFTRLSIEHGLSDNHVWSILQDRQGFMWFGTDLGGLNRYDGHEVKVYSHDDRDPRSLAHNFVWVLYEDRAGTLWVGTNGGGLDRYDRETDTFDHYRHDPTNPRALPHDNVKSLFEDAAGDFWVGTDGGLARMDRRAGTFSVFRHDPADPASLRGDRIFSILQDRHSGHLWLGAMHSGATVFDPRTGRVITHYRHDMDDPRSLTANSVRLIAQDRRGDLWLCTREGLNHFDRAREAFVRFRPDPGDPHGLADSVVTSAHEDHAGRFWVTTVNGGLQLMDRDTGRFVTYRHDPGNAASLGDDIIRTLYEDRTGAIWIGTQNGGVSRLDAQPDSFLTYRHNPGDSQSLTYGAALALHEDRAGTLWIGTTKGLNRFDGSRFVRYRHDPSDPRSLPHDDVRVIAEDAQGRLWVGTSGGGLCRSEGDGFVRYRNDPRDRGTLPGNTIETLLPARDGGLWIAPHGVGLAHFDGRRFTTWRRDVKDPTSLPTQYVLAMVEDAGGALWMGTNNVGLVRRDPATGGFTSYPLDPRRVESEAANRVHAVYADGAGVLWLGAEAGLFRFDLAAKKYTHRYTRAEGLPAGAVVSVLGDGRGGLWLGTSAGLSRFDIASGTFRTYGVADGLQANQFGWRSCARRRDGRLVFGGLGGFSVFDPAGLRDNPVVPPVVFTAFELFRRPAGVGRESPLRKAIHVAEEARLRHDQSVFTIQFAALNFSSPENNRYAYKMEGFDADWTLTNARRRSATYTNLDPGTYVFRVRGSNNHGVWNEQPRSLRIVITPPWWRTPSFLALAGLTVVVLLVAGVRLRLSTLEERERRFRTLAESAPDIVTRFDRDLRCRYVNPAVEELAGVPPASLLGKRTTELALLGEGGERWEEPLRRVFSTLQPLIHEFTFESPGGTRYFESRLVPEIGADGRARSVVAVTRDITVRKQAEEHMRTSLDEKVLLLKEVHHRVKNNLQVICSLLNLQAGTAADREAREMLQESQNRVRIMALIHEKLYESPDLARIEATQYLRTLVTTAIHSYGAHRDRIVGEVVGDEMPVDADTAIPLGLLVNELVSNALKHAFPDGRPGTIRVELWAGGGRALSLTVADDGVGLPEGLDVDRAPTLGLQLVQALVDQLNGKLEITRNGGTRFDIHLAVVKYKQRF